MQLEYQTINNDCVVAVAKGQTIVKSDIDTRDRGGAAKLLSVSTDAVATSVEAVEGEARVYGRVNYKILYLDREGKMNGLDYFGEFDFAVEDENVAVGTTEALADVLDAECTLSDDVIRLQAVCEVRLMQVVSHTAQVVVSAPGECLEDTLHAISLSPLGDVTFEVVEEVESRHNIDRVLYFDAKAIHTDTVKGVDSTTVEGKVCAEVIYLSQGEVLSQEIAFDFAEQMDVEGDVDLSLSVRQAKLVLAGEEQNNVLRVELTLCVKGYRMAEGEYRTVADVYQPDADTTLVRDSFVCRRYHGITRRSERVSARFDPAELPAHNGIVAATVSRVNVANYIAGEGQITAEGLAVAGVLYLGEDGTMQAGEVEVPFSVSFAEAGVGPNCTLVGQAIAQSVSASKNGVVEMELLFVVKCYVPSTVSYVVSVDSTPREVDDAVMSVYFAPAGATVWDVARAVHVSPNALLQQNPDLSTPADEMRRVLVFRHRQLD